MSRHFLTVSYDRDTKSNENEDYSVEYRLMKVLMVSNDVFCEHGGLKMRDTFTGNHQ